MGDFNTQVGNDILEEAITNLKAKKIFIHQACKDKSNTNLNEAMIHLNVEYIIE
jgi:hypothetical protein